MSMYMHTWNSPPDFLKEGSQVGKAALQTSLEVDRILAPDVVAYHDPALE